MSAEKKKPDDEPSDADRYEPVEPDFDLEGSSSVSDRDPGTSRDSKGKDASKGKGSKDGGNS